MAFMAGWWWHCRRRRTGPARPAYESVFGKSPRIVLASMTAFWVGEFANSFVLAKMKI